MGRGREGKVKRALYAGISFDGLSDVCLPLDSSGDQPQIRNESSGVQEQGAEYGGTAE